MQQQKDLFVSTESVVVSEFCWIGLKVFIGLSTIKQFNNAIPDFYVAECLLICFHCCFCYIIALSLYNDFPAYHVCFTRLFCFMFGALSGVKQFTTQCKCCC